MPLVVDTNILLDFPQIIKDKEEEDIYILTDVLKELDGLKLNPNPDTSFKARRAAVVISRNIDNLFFISMYEKDKILVDDKLLNYCAATPQKTLVTNDIYLKVKAKIIGIDCRGYGGTEEYTGIRNILVAADENGYHPDLEYILENKKLLDIQKPLRENEYVIIKNLSQPIKTKYGDDYEVLFTGVNQKGQIQPILKNAIMNPWINKITPRNPEQTCLFHALNSKDRTIVYAGGGFGVGKSYLLNNYAIQELERGHISKIVYVPNNAFTENTIDIGSLPG